MGQALNVMDKTNIMGQALNVMDKTNIMGPEILTSDWLIPGKVSLFGPCKVHTQNLG